MYSKFFGLKENPFNLTTNPAYLFLGKSHEEALAHLIYAVSEGEGFVSLIGEKGVGKTIICRAFIESRDQSTEVAYIFNPKLSPKDLLKKINTKFNIKVDGDDTKALIDSLNDFLMQKRQEGKKVVLFLDDAQNLNASVLEQVRLLSNLETTRDKLLQIVLVGNPKLVDMLNSPALRQIGQRVSVSYYVKPLTSAETRSYIDHRIGICSLGDPVKFDSSALKIIDKYSNGIPRMINIACDKSLATAHRLNRKHINGDIAKAAILDLKGRTGRRGFGFLSRRVIAMIAMGCFLMAVSVLVVFLSRQTNQKTNPAKGEVKTYEIKEESVAETENLSKPAIKEPTAETKKPSKPAEEEIVETEDRAPELPEAEKPPVKTAAIAPPTPKPNNMSTQTSTKMTHSVQVGAFLNKENSAELSDTLRQKGYQARIVVISGPRERTWYTVRIGDYPSRSLAQQYAAEFSSQENMQSAVRPYGKF